jgi:hypothetical protein
MVRQTSWVQDFHFPGFGILFIHILRPYVGFEVLTAVVMKSIIFWDITLCSLLKVNGCFGGTYRFRLQGRRINRVRNQRESRWQAELCLLVSYSDNSFTLKIEAISSSEKSVEFSQTTRRYIFENITFILRLLWREIGQMQISYLRRTTQTEKHTDMHLYPERNSNPSSQFSSRRRQ